MFVLIKQSMNKLVLVVTPIVVYMGCVKYDELKGVRLLGSEKVKIKYNLLVSLCTLPWVLSRKSDWCNSCAFFRDLNQNKCTVQKTPNADKVMANSVVRLEMNCKRGRCLLVASRIKEVNSAL